MVYSAAPGQVPQDAHVVRAGRCKSRDECPAEKQLALSDRTPSVRLTDFLTDCSGSPTLARTLPPGLHPIGTHPPNPSTLHSAVPDYVDLTLAHSELPGSQSPKSYISHPSDPSGQQLSIRNCAVKQSSRWKGEALLQNSSCFTQPMRVRALLI